MLLPLSHIVGNFLYGNWNRERLHLKQVAFINIILGFIWIIATFGIIITKGKTINSLIVTTLLFHYFTLKTKPTLSVSKIFANINWGLITLFCIAFFSFVFFQAFRLQYFNANYVYSGWGDYSTYSDFAESMLLDGCERIMNWLPKFSTSYMQYSSNPTPYHYFELWVDALILKVTTFKGIYAFNFIFIPFVNAIIALSFYCLSFSFIKEPKYSKYFLAIVSIIFTFYVGHLPFKIGGWDDNGFLYPRVFFFYTLLASFVILYKQKYINSAVFFLALICFLNLLYLPTICCCIFILFLYRSLILKEKNYLPLFIAFISALIFYVFYFILFKSETLIATAPLKTNWVGHIKQGCTIFFRLQLLRILLFYFPIILFIALNVKKYFAKFNKNNDFGIVLMLCSLQLISLFFASFVPHLESGTFNSIILNPLLSIFAFISFLLAIKNITSITNKIVVLCISTQAVYSIIFIFFNLGGGPYLGNKYGKSFLNTIAKENFRSKNGAFLIDTAAYKTSIFSNNVHVSWNSSVLDIKDNGYNQISLTAPIQEKNIPFEEIKELVFYSPMYQFGSKTIANKQFLNRDSLNLQFIKLHHLTYAILAPKLETPTYLQPIISNVITDSISGVTIITLKDN
jgi:hypothetical protein